MPKVYIKTFGCQMNVHDSEKMVGILRSEGYTEVNNPEDADIVILNTCSVRQKAEQKFFSQLGRIKSLKEKRPGVKIAVAGCIAQQDGVKLLERAPYVDYVIGPQNIPFLQDIIESPSGVVTKENPFIADIDIPAERKDGVRAFVNIMYGCDNFCSYCVVPYTRGREKSRAGDSIINEIRRLAENGYKEVTLLGQNVNSYRSSLNFPGLLREINKINGIERIRFVTSHPKDISDELIYAIRDMEKVCEHIHLPLQSGSTRILGVMNRRYTYGEYLKKIERLRREVPGIAISSDIIAGFPGETDGDHSLTINALKEIEFDGIFAFKFSQRPRTKASGMSGQLSDDIKSERLYEIIKVQNEITEKKNKGLVGTLQEILVEGESEKNNNRLTGRTRTNKVVNIQGRDCLTRGEIIPVKIIKAFRHSLEGELIRSNENVGARHVVPLDI
ncbi:tRNA (N6-isopentenyl adenosine(37)-C2)-methylthiotransferase MiaB [Thermodesulfovibrionales bacterium]|nr:tRNA (N6-isopentenyl adenosine(37)-C2)-methylthiotransferase MiaB [Thermodesulfovibrionales bacterium]MCL0042464.1 tRNA (N6-isopentenyl adenosine(37)-C2)-methylthiotransferase MiaB [Thermodesulfovibrionales bacterium]MCL0051566.1 tRNA (N6-isopentenyl adenosine(37)-C2)-methylthiotransferase MiaB [Thermodesulfovibrionales bacterium]MCL0086402.1 tRNA (N6-isopentenyl adenosine(37)-C2)-methylthiotransferase MiaB [Thermodesulfovibrionales bacterium]MCL0096153.1 tRNA (N6-isopentenyl adenosine(37)-C